MIIIAKDMNSYTSFNALEVDRNICWNENLQLLAHREPVQIKCCADLDPTRTLMIQDDIALGRRQIGSQFTEHQQASILFQKFLQQHGLCIGQIAAVRQYQSAVLA